PTPEQIAESTIQGAYRLKLFGIEPKVALLSHSNFGSHDDPSARKMRQALEILRKRAPRLEAAGELMAGTAWDGDFRRRIFPNTTLEGRANLFVMPNLDAANIVYNMVRVMTDGVALGPILMGVSKPAHVLTTASRPRRVVNMTAIAAVEAQIRKQRLAERGGGAGFAAAVGGPVSLLRLRGRKPPAEQSREPASLPPPLAGEGRGGGAGRRRDLRVVCRGLHWPASRRAPPSQPSPARGG